jgi:hypothetical protein
MIHKPQGSPSKNEDSTDKGIEKLFPAVFPKACESWQNCGKFMETYFYLPTYFYEMNQFL